jgi:hypothetical protein
VKPYRPFGYLIDLAGQREHDALDRVIRNKSAAGMGDSLRQLQLEEAIGDLERFSRLRGYAERLPAPPGPYTDRGGFFRDMLWAADGDVMARQRLGDQTRRAQEIAGAEFRAHAHGGWAVPEPRAVASSALAGLVPEGFAIGDAGGLPRSARPFLDAILVDGGRAELPDVGTRVTFLASTTQSITASVQSENAVSPATDIIAADSEVTVEAVAASIIVSRQVFDRSPAETDQFIGAELRRAVDEEQERRFVSGLLAGGVSAVAANTASQRSVGAAVLQAARVGADIRKQPTRVLAWHPRRWLWMSFLRNDTTSSTMDDVFYELQAGGHVQNVMSHALLQTGSLAGQDTVVAMCGSDVRYAEEPSIRAYIDRSSQAGPLGVRIWGYRYAAWAPIYPTQIGAASGSGLAAPAAFTIA